MHEVFGRRFEELQRKQSTIRFHSGGMGSVYVPDGGWAGWATSAQSLLKAVFGETGQQYVNFSTAYLKCGGSESSVRTLFNIFSSAKEDFDGGYVFNVELRVSGEVFGDFVALARQSLQEGSKDVAAVLACAALEDALKRYAAANGLDVGGKTMSDVINALKSASLVAGPQKSLLERMPAIRNSALHGEWAKIDDATVGSVLGYVEHFLLTKFSN